MATILHKRKSTSGSIPGSGDLTQGELAVNTADGRLYTKLHSGAVVNLAAQSLAGQTVPGSTQFGAIGYDSVKIDNGGNPNLYRTITLKPNTLGANRSQFLPDANCDLACTWNGTGGIPSGLTVNQKLNTLRNNLGDPSVEETALFHGQMYNQLRFRAPALQEESADGGATWTTSTRATAAQLGDMMRGEGEGTSFNAMPSGSSTPIGYRLTWDSTSTGLVYWYLNHLYIWNSTNGNQVTFTVEAYHNTNGWTQFFSGTVGNYPGHVSIKHTTIPYYPSNAALYGKLRITFMSTTVSTPVTIYAIEWFGGYPSGKRNAESYDRDKNVTFPGNVKIANGGSDSAAGFRHASWPGTGMNILSSDTLEFVTGNSKRMRVSNYGVGIGTSTTTPSSMLVVRGSTSLSTASALDVQNSGSTSLLKVLNDGSTIISQRLGVGAECRSNLAADFSGSVGLAWSDTSFIGIQYLNTDSYRLGLTANPNSRQTKIIAKAADSAGNIGFFPGNGLSEAARIHSNGYLGIATTSPTARLTVAGHGTGTMELGTTGHGGNYTGLCFNNSGNSATDVNIFSSPTDKTLYFNRPSGAAMRFREANAEQVIIASGGNVGIGTTSPSQKLHVAGTILAAGATPDIVLFSNSSSGEGRFYVDDTDGFLFLENSNGEVNCQSSLFVGGWFGAGLAKDALTVDGNDNVGVGTWGEANTRLLVRGGGASSLTKSLVVENSSGTDILTVRNDNRVGVNQPSPAYTFDVNGTARVASTLTVGSSVSTSTLNASTINGDFIYANEMMLGGGSPGFLAILDGNANTCFSANMYDGVYTTGPLEFKPSDSYSPGDVGHVVFERVSDTQLRIIMRGTDSVDRSVTLTLS